MTSDRSTSNDEANREHRPDTHLGLGGLLKGLGYMVERLNELSKSGEEVNHTSTFGRGDGLGGVLNIQMRTGLSEREETGDGFDIQPEPRPNRGRAVEEVVVQEVREPEVDVHDEGDHLRVIAEMPGIEEGDVCFEIIGDVLSLHAEGEDAQYHTELLLPKLVEGGTVRVNNGIVELTCPLRP